MLERDEDYMLSREEDLQRRLQGRPPFGWKGKWKEEAKGKSKGKGQWDDYKGKGKNS